VGSGSLLGVQLLLCGWAEIKRWEDFKNPGSQGDGSFLGITDDFKGVSNGYPGGKYFDPLGFSRSTPAAYEQYKVWTCCILPLPKPWKEILKTLRTFFCFLLYFFGRERSG
jgi:Chlorophyll A-B binding protein